MAKGRALRALLGGIGMGVLVIALAGPASAAPSNDNVANATTIREPLAKHHGVSITGSNVGATTGPGEPSPCKASHATVWYRYVPRRNHHAFAQVSSRRSDPITPTVAVYSQAAILQNVIGCDEDFDFNGVARVNFEAVRGYTYFIQVDSVPCLFTSPSEGASDCDVDSPSEVAPTGNGEGNFTLYVK